MPLSEQHLRELDACSLECAAILDQMLDRGVVPARMRTVADAAIKRTRRAHDGWMPTLMCHSCGGVDLVPILDLGNQPVANALLRDATLQEPEPRYPLGVVFCPDCALLQVSGTLSPEILFKHDYPYFSSSSPALLVHARQHAERLRHARGLGRASLVVEVACNDGYLLRNFRDWGVPVLGIDPADGPMAAAKAAGIPVLHEFFDTRLARQLAADGVQADVIIANNVCAHVGAINDFVDGFRYILKPAGLLSIEVAYVVDTVERNEFDQIYHEHYFYHSLHSLKNLFGRHELHLNDAEHLPHMHGGSIRAYFGSEPHPTPRVADMLARERARLVDRAEFFRPLGERAFAVRDALRTLLLDVKAQGASIACYGAAAKGTTLTNFLDLGPGFFDFVCDANPHKHGKWMPGQRIPIVAPEELERRRPDYCLMLVWNFADEVMAQRHAYVERGGRFILPSPWPRIVEPEDARPGATIDTRHP
jgi:SAM-dependent methyltransferase